MGKQRSKSLTERVNGAAGQPVPMDLRLGEQAVSSKPLPDVPRRPQSDCAMPGRCGRAWQVREIQEMA